MGKNQEQIKKPRSISMSDDDWALLDELSKKSYRKRSEFIIYACVEQGKRIGLIEK